jgi:ribosomal protein S18 acetylase RimI-like enzyme
MQHPLRQARPTDSFLRLRVDDRAIGAYAVDGDHVVFLRTGRKSGETWATALGDDPARILALIDSLRGHGFDGVTVHDEVFAHLPADLRGPDPGHWSLWELVGAPPSAECALADSNSAGSGSARAHSVQLTLLASDDPRIDPLLAHSSSAYIYAGDPKINEWRGILDGDRLVAVGAWTTSSSGDAHLVSICTDPEYRGRGLGRAVTAVLASAALEQGVPGVTLEMYAGNEPAARAYRAVGFAERGRYMSALIHGGPSSPDAEE